MCLKLKDRRNYFEDDYEVSVVVLPCCGYSLRMITILPQRMVIKAIHFYLISELVFVNICTPCWYLHSLLDDIS